MLHFVLATLFCIQPIVLVLGGSPGTVLVGKNDAVRWRSAYPNVAKVDGKGWVKAVSYGTTTIITTRRNGETFVYTVYVVPRNTDGTFDRRTVRACRK